MEEEGEEEKENKNLISCRSFSVETREVASSSEQTR